MLDLSQLNLRRVFMMTLLLAIALYAFSMSITPGPVNMILFSTGANHGFKKAIPFATEIGRAHV